MLTVGDSLVSSLSRYLEIWRKYFDIHRVLNSGIAADKQEITSIFHLISI